MSTQARQAALKDVLKEQRLALTAIGDRLAQDPGDAALNRQRRELDSRMEQTEIELKFLGNPRALADEYTVLAQTALQEASAAGGDSETRDIFVRRADFCETVANEALRQMQQVPDLDTSTLQTIQGDLARAAREAKQTVDSINAAIGFANKALDGLVMLASVAAKLMV